MIIIYRLAAIKVLDNQIYVNGAVHKVRNARVGGAPRRCDSLWQGEGIKSMWCHTSQKTFIHMKP